MQGKKRYSPVMQAHNSEIKNKKGRLHLDQMSAIYPIIGFSYHKSSEIGNCCIAITDLASKYQRSHSSRKLRKRYKIHTQLNTQRRKRGGGLVQQITHS